jgi:hypothetical protein
VAVGDDAAAAGYPLVQGSDPEQQGYIEINRTRDMIADVLSLILPVWPTSKGGTGASDVDQAKTNLGISSGTDPPSDAVGGSVDGNIYFRISS